VIVLLVYLASQTLLPRSEEAEKVTYSQLVSTVETAPGSIQEVMFSPKGRSIEVTPKSTNEKKFKVNYPSDESQIEFQNLLQRQDVAFDSKGSGSSALGSILGMLLPLLLIFGLFIFLMSRMQGGGGKIMSFGKSRAKRVAPDSPKITFKDVAGVDEAVEELHEIKEFLENPKKFQALGARIPKGVLLYGPPGTGKTLLARSVAGEAGVPFFSISGSDFVEMFVGVGASRVRDLFEQAKQASPCIIFMDEIDAVGRHRGAGLGGGHDEREQTLNQLLVEMDGFEMKDNIILIAATNRPDILDPALLRPGRFDRQIVVDRPDRNGRRKILEVHTKGKPIDGSVDLDTLAAGTPGFTGADLANLVNEAALLAARRGKKTIGDSELEEGIMRVIAGPEKKARLLSEHERKITAYHEMGHALVGHHLPNCDPVHKISIISRGQALGYTISLPAEDKFLTTKSALMDQMAMMLGGRTAEEFVFHEVTTGAADDIEKVTQTAKHMVMRYGMSDKLGPRVLGRNHDMPFLGRYMGSEPDYSEEIAREIDDEIRRVIEEAQERAGTVLSEHIDELHRISELLIERETIDKDQFERLLAGEPVFPELKPERKPRTEPKPRTKPKPRPFPIPGALSQPPPPEGASS
jgi:cell division protease FtsH